MSEEIEEIEKMEVTVEEIEDTLETENLKLEIEDEVG